MAATLTGPQDLDELEALVVHLAALYDQGLPCADFDGEAISDEEYDALVRRLRDERPDAKAFDSISPSASVPLPNEGGFMTHDPPMTSIAKADTEKREELFDNWWMRCCRELQYSFTDLGTSFSMCWKLDGVAISIRYEKGRLVQAGMRPRDGVKGTDVTANVAFVKGIPQTLGMPLSLTLRGEVICRKDDFAVVQQELAAAGEPLRANERNHAFGALRQLKEPEKTAGGRLSFIAHGIVGFKDWAKYYLNERARAVWAASMLLPEGNFVAMVPFSQAGLLDMAAQRHTLPFLTDGVVVKVNDLSHQERLGHINDDPTAEPRGAIAWKYDAEKADAVVTAITYEASRTGRITLVANFEGVPLAGTTVRRATCNNLGWAEKMGIGVGATIRIIKGGEIIPKILEVVAGATTINYPQACPACNGPVVVHVNGDKKDLRCENPQCAAKHVKGMTHFLNKLGCKGLGESSIEPLIRQGKVREWADLFKLTVEDCVECGFSSREALLALATIHKVKPLKDDHRLVVTIIDAKSRKQSVPAWQFFAALGIPQCGETAGKLLIEHFRDFRAICQASLPALRAVAGIGDISAQNIYRFCRDYEYQINRTLQHIELELPKSGSLNGQKFCLSGSFARGKEYWEALIAQKGGTCSGSVSKKTNFLVAGPGSGLKSAKANEYGIPIIDVGRLEEMLAEATQT